MATNAEALARSYLSLTHTKESGRYAPEVVNCWEDFHNAVKDTIPTGSGITLNSVSCTEEKIFLNVSYQHYTEHGFADGTTDHTIKITPNFVFGVYTSVRGRDRNQIKPLLEDVFDTWTRADCPLKFEDFFLKPEKESLNAATEVPK